MKKRINTKGLTLIEMLGAIAVLGILGTVGIAATSKYIAHSRQKSYKTMSQSIYEAAENCIIEGTCNAPGTISTDELIRDGYLDGLKNPIQSKHDCNGTVTVTDAGVSSDSLEYNDYKYTVILRCEGLDNIKKDYVWPDAKSQKK